METVGFQQEGRSDPWGSPLISFKLILPSKGVSAKGKRGHVSPTLERG